jgi:hypothetical protein
VGRKQQWGWHRRDDSWEEAPFSWHEQVEQSFLRRRSAAEQEALAERLQDDYPERDDPDTPPRFPGKEIRTPRQ